MQKAILTSAIILFVVIGCTKKEAPQDSATVSEAGGANSLGIGPIKSLTLEAELQPDLVKKGADIFTAKCAACHRVDEKYVGPSLKGVTERRAPEWIMNMILNPAEMLEKDPTAREMLAEFMVPMTFQNVSEEEARAILEYFRSNDKK